MNRGKLDKKERKKDCFVGQDVLVLVMERKELL
jgi:hypothetical protein